MVTLYEFFRACSFNLNSVVMEYIVNGGDVNIVDDKVSDCKRTGLIVVARCGALNCVESLISANADLDTQDSESCTALIYAARFNKELKKSPS